MATQEIRSQVIGEIYKRDGYVTASAVVKEATPKRSPIHDEFEWDDKKAAHEHRLSTARRMIRVTTIRSETGVRQRLINIPTVRVDGPTAQVVRNEGVYKPAVEVAKVGEDYDAAVRQLQAQMRAIERTLHDLRRAAGRDVSLVDRLDEAMGIARDTLRLMLNQSA